MIDRSKFDAILWKYPEFNTPSASFEAHMEKDGTLVIDKWDHPTVPKPDEAAIAKIVADFNAYADQKEIDDKQARKLRKRAARQALGNFPKDKLRGLKELIEDLNED